MSALDRFNHPAPNALRKADADFLRQLAMDYRNSSDTIAIAARIGRIADELEQSA